jgi:hypothetical protein
LRPGCLKCLAAPHDFPINDGTYRPLKVISPRDGAERHKARADAGVDDLPDDGDRHDFPCARAGHTLIESSLGIMPT